jgi:hypothetical protein
MDRRRWTIGIESHLEDALLVSVKERESGSAQKTIFVKSVSTAGKQEQLT